VRSCRTPYGRFCAIIYLNKILIISNFMFNRNWQRIFLPFLAFGIVAAWWLIPSGAEASACVSGQLIRASSPSVYYCGADGKRYVFPNEKTYRTWYSDFSGVSVITDEALASIPIGGNVTYKPGVRMVKITTSPKVYVVDTGGVLRGIASEDVAQQLYGSTWNQQIDDVPDAFFANYLLGSDVTVASDFTPLTARNRATNINVNRGLEIGNAQGVFLSISPDVTTLAAGDSVDVTVTVNDTSGISSASIFLNGNLIRTCDADGATTATCTKTIYGDDYGDGAILNLYGQEVSRYSVRSVTDTKTIVTSGGSANDNGVVTMSFSSDDTELESGQSITVTASAYDPVGLSSVSIYVNGALMQRCSQNGVVTTASCSSTIYANNYATGSVVTVYVQEINSSGTPTLSSSSDLTIVSGYSDGGTASISISPDEDTLRADEMVDVLISAYDTLGFSNISVRVNGAVAKTCSQSGTTANGRCLVTLYGSNYSVGSDIDIYGEVTNSEGDIYVTSTKTITILAGSVVDGSVSLSFSPYAQSLAVGQTTTVTAHADLPSGVSEIRFYVNDELEKTCTLSGSSSTASCSVALDGSSYTSGSIINIYAEASGTNSESGTSTTSSLVITSASADGGSVVLYLAPVLSSITGTQTVTVTANAYDPSGLSEVSIFVNGSNVRTCDQSGSWPTGASCSYTISANDYATGSTVTIYGRGTNVFTTTADSTSKIITVL
jgi:hypothetical protein